MVLPVLYLHDGKGNLAAAVAIVEMIQRVHHVLENSCGVFRVEHVLVPDGGVRVVVRSFVRAQHVVGVVATGGVTRRLDAGSGTAGKESIGAGVIAVTGGDGGGGDGCGGFIIFAVGVFRSLELGDIGAGGAAGVSFVVQFLDALDRVGVTGITAAAAVVDAAKALSDSDFLVRPFPSEAPLAPSASLEKVSRTR